MCRTTDEAHEQRWSRHQRWAMDKRAELWKFRDPSFCGLLFSPRACQCLRLPWSPASHWPVPHRPRGLRRPFIPTRPARPLLARSLCRIRSVPRPVFCLSRKKCARGGGGPSHGRVKYGRITQRSPARLWRQRGPRRQRRLRGSRRTGICRDVFYSRELLFFFRRPKQGKIRISTKNISMLHLDI